MIPRWHSDDFERKGTRPVNVSIDTWSISFYKKVRTTSETLKSFRRSIESSTLKSIQEILDHDVTRYGISRSEDVEFVALLFHCKFLFKRSLLKIIINWSQKKNVKLRARSFHIMKYHLDVNHESLFFVMMTVMKILFTEMQERIRTGFDKRSNDEFFKINFVYIDRLLMNSFWYRYIRDSVHFLVVLSSFSSGPP